jgi:hypothetical protein
MSRVCDEFKGGETVKTNTKRLLLTVLLVGTIFSVLTVTTVTASTNGLAHGEQQRDQDRVQDCDAREDHTGSMCPNDCNGVTTMSQTRHRYQYRHCKN